ncbi:uncharacterized protein [Henckelia pumila]|uniref:uncharacterized protein n=1 Tax=Henckelia pumila TaxID=405737 RepID=UPI003C6E1A22
MDPFEELYGKKCRSPLYWDDVSEVPELGPDMIRQMTEKNRGPHKGLNPEIHDRVSVGEYMTYEGLVSQCHQEEDIICRSGGVMRFGKKNQGPCNHCGGNHPTNRCRKVSGACFFCGEIRHLKKDFPQAGGAHSSFGSQASVHQRPQGQSTGGSNLKLHASSQVFALRNDHAVDENEKVIAGMFLLFDIPAFAFIDTSSSHYFISAHFVKRHKIPYISLDSLVVVSTPKGQSASAKRLMIGCPLEFLGNILMVNLMILAMEDLECILGIDVLTTYRDLVDCYQRLVKFHPFGGDSWFFYGERARPQMIFGIGYESLSSFTV